MPLIKVYTKEGRKERQTPEMVDRVHVADLREPPTNCLLSSILNSLGPVYMRENIVVQRMIEYSS